MLFIMFNHFIKKMGCLSKKTINKLTSVLVLLYDVLCVLHILNVLIYENPDIKKRTQDM